MAQRHFRTQLRLANLSFVLLLLAATGVLMVFSARHRARWDWTATNSNSLSIASVSLLRTLPQPITIKAFIGDDTSARNHIRQLIARYQRVKPDVRLVFVNPTKHPNQVRTAGIQFQGEMQIAYQQRVAVVSQPSEQTITNTLAGLGRSGLTKLVFATGSGERSPTGNAPYDLSAWTRQLQARGIEIAHSDLSGQTVLVPGKAVLVLASPQVGLLPGQVSVVRKFVEAGGDMLWLQDPGPMHGLKPLATDLHIGFLPGEVVDPTSQVLTGRADFIAVLHYGVDPVLSGLHMVTVFPSARGLTVQPGQTDWHATPFLTTVPSAWEAVRPVSGTVQFHPHQDVAGPINIGFTLERQIKGRTQRIVLMGNGSFLANTVLGQGGNLQLAMNLSNWLTHDDANISLPSRRAPDVHLLLTPHEQMGIAISFLLLLPLLLFGTAGVLWWRRRRG